MTPDQQVALLNKLMREHIAPHLPMGTGATLMLFPMKQVGDPEGTSLVSYISSGSRSDMKDAMRKLLDRWAAAEAEREWENPTLLPFDGKHTVYTFAKFADSVECQPGRGQGFYARADQRSRVMYVWDGPHPRWATHVEWWEV